MQSGIPVDKGWGLCSAISDDPAGGTSGIGIELAGSQARAAVRTAAPRTLPGAPSWGRVLATTISLWTERRVARLRHPRMALFLTICVVVAAATVMSVVQFTGTAPRRASPARPHQVRPGWALDAAGTARAQAAAWVAGQVSSAETVGCDPLMCAALRAHGVAPSRLVPVQPGTFGITGAGVLAASLSADDAQGAPVLLASFGSGPNVVEVRIAPPGGPAAYQRAAQADLAARRSAGTQLLHSRRVQVGGQAAGQLQAGEVDTRLLIMLAMLASQHPWQVVAFGGDTPGVPLAQAPFREVTITGPDAGALAASLALVRAQRAPYQPAQAAIVRLPGGQTAQGQLALRIDFAAPSPPGLLTGGTSG
jgi:hypothetical protein